MLVAERMLIGNEMPVSNLGVVSELTQSITYKRWDGVMMTLAKGTIIHVDEAKERGSHGDDYFDIGSDEYRILYPN